MFQKIISAIKFTIRQALWLLYFFSKLVPRDKKIWIFGSWDGKSFSDNPKYLYLYINQYQKSKIKAIWITKNRKVLDELRANGFSAYMKKSLKGMYYALRGKYWFYGHFTTDIAFWLSGGAVKFNLHHGTPIKKILWDNFNNIERYRKNKIIEIISRLKVPWRFQSPDYLLITNRKLKNAFMSAFEVGEKSLVYCGNPRTDIIHSLYNGFEIWLDKETFEFAKREKIEKNSTIILYMPTFREKGISAIVDFFENSDILELVEKKKIVLLVKEHPWGKRIDKRKYESERVRFINKHSDHNPFFRLTDILITDYSSVFIDFLITGKPIVFIAYDVKKFVKESRELYFNYKDSTPGYRIFKMKDLTKVIEHIIEKGDFLESQRKRVLEMFYSVKKKDASECIFKFIMSVNEKNKA